jgi:hypothetical protein
LGNRFAATPECTKEATSMEGVKATGNLDLFERKCEQISTSLMQFFYFLYVDKKLGRKGKPIVLRIGYSSKNVLIFV